MDLNILENDIILASNTIKPDQNRYDIIFKCSSINIVVDEFIKNLERHFGGNYEVHVKLIQSYIQTKNVFTPIIFNKVLKREIKPTSDYSFIIFTNPGNTLLKFTSTTQKVKKGDLIIFKTEDFVKDISRDLDRIALIGSITNKINNKMINKSIF